MSDVMASVAASEPAAQPLTGHLTASRRHRLELLDACIDSPSDVVRLRIRTPAYLLKLAEGVKRAVLDAQHLHAQDQRNIGARANRIFGDGLMTSSGQRHRQMRERVQPAF